MMTTEMERLHKEHWTPERDKKRKAQTRKEQAKGRKALTTAKVARTKAEQAKGRNAAKLSAREQEKALKDYYAKEKRLNELEKEDVARAPIRGLKANDLRPDPLQVDPNMVLPRAVQAAVNDVNARYQPHAKLVWEFEVLGLTPHLSEIMQLICDGGSEAIKIILAQHGLSAVDGRVTYFNVAIQPKQKEVTNGE